MTTTVLRKVSSTLWKSERMRFRKVLVFAKEHGGRDSALLLSQGSELQVRLLQVRKDTSLPHSKDRKDARNTTFTDLKGNANCFFFLVS